MDGPIFYIKYDCRFCLAKCGWVQVLAESAGDYDVTKAG